MYVIVRTQVLFLSTAELLCPKSTRHSAATCRNCASEKGLLVTAPLHLYYSNSCRSRVEIVQCSFAALSERLCRVRPIVTKGIPFCTKAKDQE